MSNFHLLGTFDPMPLLHQIRCNAGLWKEDTYLRDYPQGPFKNTETIFLRFPPASVSELEQGKTDQHECIWMDGAIHLPAARNIIFNLMATVQGERLGRVMINKLVPGGKVYPHADTPIHANYWERYHCVLQSSPGCNFRCGEENTYMAPGQVVWFQNAIEHDVFNGGAIDRLHMIVDIRTSHFDFKGRNTQT